MLFYTGSKSDLDSQQLEAGLIQEGLELLENTEYKKHYMNQLWLNDYVLTTLDNHWFC